MYLLPFEMLVKDGKVAAIMSAYNRIRGVYATEYRYTLHDILRDEWGFEGYVQSDFWSVRSAAPSLNAGLDHEMPDAKWLNETNITNALNDTSTEMKTIDQTPDRRYAQMFRFGQFERPTRPRSSAAAHGAISRRLGCLLRNDAGLLPIESAEWPDRSSAYRSPSSPARAAVGRPSIRCTRWTHWWACATCWPRWVRTRRSTWLSWPTTWPTGRRAKAPTILEVWNQGAEDGHVVADLIFGRVNPSGKVPTTHMREAGDTLFANHPQRYPGTDEGAGYPVLRYSEGLAVGYRWFQSQGIEPLFCFGHGLSYTTFELCDCQVDAAGFDGRRLVTVSVRVRNTGERAGAEVVQVYLGVPVSGQPPKRLVGFAKVMLEAGESRVVEISIDPLATNHPFSVWDYASRDFAVLPGDYTVYVGTSSEDTPFSEVITVG